MRMALGICPVSLELAFPPCEHLPDIDKRLSLPTPSSTPTSGLHMPGPTARVTHVSTHLSDFVAGEQAFKEISLHTQKQINSWFCILPQQEFRKIPEVFLPLGGVAAIQI